MAPYLATDLGTAEMQIEQFFTQHMPLEQVPYRDSEGAQYWDQLFHLQYPKQDIGLSYCSSVPPECHKLYQLILDDRNRHALEIGRVELVTENDLVSIVQ